MTLQDEQLKLLFHDDYLYFVRACDGPQTEPHKQFEFGRRIPVEGFIARDLLKNRPMSEALDVYFRMAVSHIVPAMIYSADHVGGYYEPVGIHEVVPISPELMADIARFNYDLRRAPGGVVDQLQEVITQIRRIDG